MLGDIVLVSVVSRVTVVRVVVSGAGMLATVLNTEGNKRPDTMGEGVLMK